MYLKKAKISLSVVGGMLFGVGRLLLFIVVTCKGS